MDFLLKGKGNLHETQRSVTKCESIWAWETNLTFFKKIIIVITLFTFLLFLHLSLFFPVFILFCFFFLSFHQFTVDSMKASITHDFGCYIQYPKSSIRIGVKVIGIFVLRKQKKTKPKEKKTNFVDLRITKWKKKGSSIPRRLCRLTRKT